MKSPIAGMLQLLAGVLAAVHCVGQTITPDPAQLRIATQPEGAAVYCNGKLVDSAPALISDLAPGTHLVTAEKKGYRTARRTLELRAGQKVSIDLSLDPVTALLIIRSDPDGAEVQIDGADRGKTPLLLTDLPLGRHRVRVSTAGYSAKEIDLSLEDRIPRRVEVSLTSNSAMLDVNSRPAGATVFLNGISQGITPCTVDRIPSGDVVLELQKDGYRAHKSSLRLTAGLRETVSAALEPLPGRLSVVSIPAGARVYVDNQFRGETPVELSDVEPKSYRVRVELAGFSPSARDVEVGRGRQAVEEFRLERNCGVFEITTEPAGVDVFVDNRECGATPARADTDRVSDTLRIDMLPIGHHEVRLAKSGFHDVTFAIEVERDRTIAMHQQLIERFIPDYEVRTSSGVYQGMLVETLPNGDVRLKIKNGITRTFRTDEIRTRRPLTAAP